MWPKMLYPPYLMLCSMKQNIIVPLSKIHNFVQMKAMLATGQKPGTTPDFYKMEQQSQLHPLENGDSD